MRTYVYIYIFYLDLELKKDFENIFRKKDLFQKRGESSFRKSSKPLSLRLVGFVIDCLFEISGI